MKKEELPKFLCLICLLLVVGFCIRLWVDYHQYSASLNSAPFSVWVLVRGVEFLLPAAIVLTVALILKKKG